MFRHFIAVFVAVLAFSTEIGATVDESIEVKVFDSNLRLSDQKMMELLNKTNLESHGYIKEVTTKLVSQAVSGNPVYRKSYLYYKIVHCSRLQEIDQELETLLPGIFGVDLVQKINSEIASKNLTQMKQCKVGLEVHFKGAGGCYGKKNKVRRRRKSPCWICIGFCWATVLRN